MRAHLFCHAKGPLKQTMQIWTDCSGCSGRLVGFFCLPEYLALADNHRVEPGGDPEKMLHALFSLVPIKRGRVIVGIDVNSSRKATRNLIRGNAFLRNRINLNPVTRR